MSDIAFSIVVPVYNVEQYLEDCLQSVFAGLPTNFETEVLCVDDGSTDRSSAILAAFAAKHRQVKILRQPNGGYGKAVNTGLRSANGRYLTFVESDDMVLPGRYDKILRLMEALPEVDFIKTPYQPWTTERQLDPIAVPPHGMSADALLGEIEKAAGSSGVRVHKFCDDGLCLCPPAIWSAVYRTASLRARDIALIETPGASYQDTGFSVMCFLSEMRYLWLNELYYLYRVDREAASRHRRDKGWEVFGLFDFAHSYLSQRGYFTAQARPYFYAIYFVRLLWFFERVAPGLDGPVFAKAHEKFEPVWQDEKLFLATEALLSGKRKSLVRAFRRGDRSAFDGLFGLCPRERAADATSASLASAEPGSTRISKRLIKRGKLLFNEIAAKIR